MEVHEARRQPISFLYFSHKSGLRPEELEPDEDVDQLPRLEMLATRYVKSFLSDSILMEAELKERRA